MKRIAILVNKDFEYSGFIEGLRDTVNVHAGTNGRDAECRFDNLIADIYCIQNMFGKYKYGKYDSPDNISKNSSNSEMKYGYLKDLFKSNEFRLEDCDGILSFSTSESTPISQSGLNGYKGDWDNISRNGWVYVGNKFFLSDQRFNDATTQSHLKIGTEETDNTEFYDENIILNDNLYDFLNMTKMSLKSAYKNPADNACCVAGSDFSSVGVVNVMDYTCYKKADERAYDIYQRHSHNIPYLTDPIGIETTHGVVVKVLHDTLTDIKLEKDIPVNFISPIVDRYLKFDEDVDGKYGKQNFICSYNGGVVTGHILKSLNENM